MKNQTAKQTAPSIGNIGIKIDNVNKRVKILCPNEFRTVIDIKNFLKSTIYKNTEAVELLKKFDTRFTSRIFGKEIGFIDEFEIQDGLFVSEEARIKTSVGLDIIYIGGNRKNRLDLEQLKKEQALSLASSQCTAIVPEPADVTFEELTYPLSKSDVAQLLEMYSLCFTDYLVPLDQELIQSAAKSSIFIVARNEKKRIIASAIGESLRVGTLTLLEISEVAAHPTLRIKGAASGCARRVINIGKAKLDSPVIAFWEARMWRNVLGIAPLVGLTHLGGILHQHCRISAPAQFTSVKQTMYGSLAVFYCL